MSEPLVNIAPVNRPPHYVRLSNVLEIEGVGDNTSCYLIMKRGDGHARLLFNAPAAKVATLIKAVSDQ